MPWQWCRLAAATLITPLAWELPYAAGTALKSRKEKKGSKSFEKTLSLLVAQQVKDPALSLCVALVNSVAWVRSLAGELAHAVGVPSTPRHCEGRNQDSLMEMVRGKESDEIQPGAWGWGKRSF